MTDTRFGSRKRKAKREPMELRPRHLRAIGLLASTDMRKKEVAAAVGVNSATLGRWCKDKAFCKELARQHTLQPERVDTLRLEAAELALQSVVKRFDGGYSMPPVKEIIQLLERLVGEDFVRALPVRFEGVPSPAAEPQPQPAADETTASDVEEEPKPAESAPAA